MGRGYWVEEGFVWNHSYLDWFPNLDFSLWSNDTVSHLASAIGNSLFTDAPSVNNKGGQFARACVEVFAGEELLDKVLVKVEDGSNTIKFIPVSYVGNRKRAPSSVHTLVTTKGLIQMLSEKMGNLRHARKVSVRRTLKLIKFWNHRKILFQRNQSLLMMFPSQWRLVQTLIRKPLRKTLQSHVTSPPPSLIYIPQSLQGRRQLRIMSVFNRESPGQEVQNSNWFYPLSLEEVWEAEQVQEDSTSEQGAYTSSLQEISNEVANIVPPSPLPGIDSNPQWRITISDEVQARRITIY